MKRYWVGWCMAVVAAVPGGPVQAEISARAQFSQFGYRLVDLRPGDGIAPAIKFLGGGGSAATCLAMETTPRFELSAVETLHDGFTAFKPMAVAAETPRVSAGASMAGSLARHDFSYSAQGFFQNDAASAEFKEFVARASPVGEGGQVPFEVAPFTRVIFAGQLRLDASTTEATEAANAVLVTSISSAPGVMVPVDIGVIVGRGTGKKADLISRWQRFSYTNTTAARTTGSFSAWVEVFGAVDQRPSAFANSMEPAAAALHVPAIPEPGTALLMLCGMGALAGRARSRSIKPR